jgi:hypothetical protein
MATKVSAEAEKKIDQLEEQILYRWVGLERPHKERSRDFYSTVLVLAVLVGIIFFFIEGIMLVLLTIAVVFFIFALSKTKPREVEHVVTSKGIVSVGQKYYWNELLFFWVEEKWGYTLISFVTTRRWPVQLVMVMPDDEKEVTKLREIVGEYLEYQKPEDTRLDRMIKWLQEKVPLED